jgi:hypothetical protein
MCVYDRGLICFGLGQTVQVELAGPVQVPLLGLLD